MRASEFHYELPEELIAQQPLEDRAASRMLVLDRAAGRWENRLFRQLPALIGPGDCLVVNNSRVFPSRLFGRRRGRAGLIEVFLLRPVSADKLEWDALVRPGRKAPAGECIEFADNVRAEVVAHGKFGERTVRFHLDGELHDVLERIGHVPLPPYIRRPDTAKDRDRYQTVFARHTGSVAAPTAGLHFTPQVLAACRERGAAIAEVTLHVGLGTFQPVREENLRHRRLHPEYFEVAPAAAELLRSSKRVVGIGTTSVRAIESAAQGRAGVTDLFITPGFEFRATGAMLTNFHLPSSSLLMLVCAFAGTELTLAAYRHAVEERYRFFSYGDCMLIL